MRHIVLFALLARTLSAQAEPEIRKALSRALPPIESSASAFVAKRACVSCHHNTLTVLTFRLARERGFTIDPAVLAAVEDKTFRSLRGQAALDDAVQATTLADPTPDDSTLLMAAHAAGLPPDLTTAVYARRLAGWQRDGHWVTSDFRPPHSSSVFTATATAVRAIDLYMPSELRAERDATLLKARRWLAATRPTSTEDASFRLMGLVWARASGDEIAAARRDLLAFRVRAGSWPELPGYQPDAYSTGEALYALHEAGVPATDTVWSGALKFLLSTQAADGTWRVHTRMLSPMQVSPTYFSTGFPYEKDEYLSYAGSAWTVMALLDALPSEKKPDVASGVASESPAWIRTALFGSARELTALLDGGLNPNSKTDKGTTLLMMAAPDAEKVRLLLERGADAKAKTGSGSDALNIAAAYRGTAGSIGALLNAGVSANVRGKKSPLVLASMTGDVENVKQLLAHGAEPSPGLSQAVTYGYPDVVRTLIAAGASATVSEGSGINLLHWAAITNHAEVVPALVEAGAAINAKDEFNYTPLMYAVTLDFGDTGVLKALLKAGADPKIRNDQGRTALEQARYYRHTLLEAAMR